jgi:hypothetical protein
MNIGRSYYRTETVKRRTYTVNNSAEKLRTERDLTGLPQRNNLCARYNTLHFLRRHQIQFITGKADYLGIQIAVAGINTADGTHGGATAYRLKGKSHNAYQFPRHIGSWKLHIGF